MSELQIYLLAGGGVFVAAVLGYNIWQERAARRKAESAFGERPADALFDAPPAERREPTLGAMPASAGIDATMPPTPRKVRAEELEAP
ncbi:MAG: cell division protein ZipA, partial [Pseudomonadota bacterium]|nr:cell division protein ZipA [Pseudomonadota bacterium]